MAGSGDSTMETTAIAGVVSVPLREIATEGGPVLHMLRADSPLFQQFGEMYFSEVLPGAVKGWKRHTLQTQLFAVPAGTLKIMLHDAREGSPSNGVTLTLVLGRPDQYRLLRIPPGIWYAFSATSATPALIANCPDMPHTPEEAERLPLDSPLAPCAWR